MISSAMLERGHTEKASDAIDIKSESNSRSKPLRREQTALMMKTTIGISIWHCDRGLQCACGGEGEGH